MLKLNIAFLFFILFWACSSTHSLGQPHKSTIIVTGSVVDSIEKENIKIVSVTVLNAIDSSTIKQLNTGTHFKIKLSQGDYLLKLSSLGYKSITLSVFAGPGLKQIKLGSINLVKDKSYLKEVTVFAIRKSIEMKRDTILYHVNPSSYRPSAKAQDIIKNLSGMSVDRDGRVEDRGKTVQRVLVNGKKFFGNDLALAIQNLPAELITKIEVYDDKTDDAKFSGIDDGTRIRTINIVTKKLKDLSYLSEVKTTGGTGNYRDLYGNFNLMKADKSLTLIGELNHGGLTGGSGFSSSIVQGNPRSTLGAFNFSAGTEKTIQINGSFQRLNSNNKISQTILTQTLLPENVTQINNADQFSNNKGVNTSFNFNLIKNIDSLLSVNLTSTISNQKNTINRDAVTSIYDDDALINRASSGLVSNMDGFNSNFNLYLSRRFKKAGRVLTIGTNMAFNSNNQMDQLLSSIMSIDTVIQNQKTYNRHPGHAISATLSYTEPLTKSSSFTFGYQYSWSPSQNERRTYQYNPSIQNYSQDDSLSSAGNRYYYQFQKYSIQYNYESNTIQVMLGANTQYNGVKTIIHNLTAQDYNYTNINPLFRVGYSFKNSTSLNFDYQGTLSQPPSNLLQPIIDNSDPLNIQLGNPGLKQSFNNSFNLSINHISQKTGSSTYSTINYTLNRNQITEALSVLEDGTKVTKPFNVNGNYNIAMGIGRSFNFKPISSTLNLSTGFSFQQSSNEINQDKNVNSYLLYRLNLTWNSTLFKSVYISLIEKPSTIVNRNSMSNDEITSFNNVINFDASWYNDQWSFNTFFTHLYNKGQNNTAASQVALLNCSLERKLASKTPLSVIFSIYNLLDQNSNYTKTIVGNVIQESFTNTSSRYIMLGVKFAPASL